MQTFGKTTKRKYLPSISALSRPLKIKVDRPQSYKTTTWKRAVKFHQDHLEIVLSEKMQTLTLTHVIISHELNVQRKPMPLLPHLIKINVDGSNWTNQTLPFFMTRQKCLLLSELSLFGAVSKSCHCALLQEWVCFLWGCDLRSEAKHLAETDSTQCFPAAKVTEISAHRTSHSSLIWFPTDYNSSLGIMSL